MEAIIIFILFAAVVILAGNYHALKKQLKSISRQLHGKQTRLVTVEFVDRDLETAAQEINGLLEQMQQIIIQNNASSAALKSAIADISHDMKTPLTSVIGYLQLAEKECKEKKVREMLRICLERTQYCNSLINDFFELSVLESQGCAPTLENVDVAGMLCEQILASYPVFEEKGIVPHFEDSAQPVFASADFHMLNRVILNLISNGVKYTDGELFFSVRKAHGQVILTVSNSVNTYVDLARIFDRFYTQDASRSQGSGIGLYVCRQLVEAMGGSICAEMEGNRLSVRVVLEQEGEQV